VSGSSGVAAREAACGRLPGVGRAKSAGEGEGQRKGPPGGGPLTLQSPSDQIAAMGARPFALRRNAA
jgi:hypothetical protein